LPDAVVPVLNTTLPVVPEWTAFAVVRIMEPVELEWLPPDARYTDPPTVFETEASPACIVRDPPVSEPEDPARIATDPPTPELPDPATTLIEPPLPLAAEPVIKVRDPEFP